MKYVREGDKEAAGVSNKYLKRRELMQFTRTLIFLLTVVFLLSGCSLVPRRPPVVTPPEEEVSPQIEMPEEVTEEESKEILKEDLPFLEREAEELGIEIPKNHPAIAKWVNYYRTKGWGKLRRALNRGAPYLPYIKEIFRENGLPEELAYLPVVESAFRNHARSRAGAVGLWQFMPSTGRKYGLRIDRWVDDRRDPIRSTYAAVKYLKYLYSLFGRWDLALASYNVGEGKVLSRIRRLRTKNFWKLRRRLPRETREYVPAFFAVLLIANQKDRYGLDSILNQDPWKFDTVRVPRQVELSLVAKWASSTLSEIKRLNPRYRRTVTPPDERNFLIRIPPGRRTAFLAAMGSTPRSEWVRTTYHRVRRGETLSRIARRYGVTVRDIARANGIRNYNRLRVGQVLKIPLAGEPVYASKRSYGRSSVGSKIYRVRRGESLWSIARRYGVKVSDLKRWNSIRGSKIYPGQRLVVRPSLEREIKYITYRIKRGDTLYEIAAKYNVSIRTLKRINNISNPRRLRPGQRIKIPTTTLGG